MDDDWEVCKPIQMWYCRNEDRGIRGYCDEFAIPDWSKDRKERIGVMSNSFNLREKASAHAVTMMAG